MVYLHTLSTVTVPILIVCVIGVLVQRIRPFDTASVVDISLYVLAPALVVVVLGTSKLSGHNVLEVSLFALIQGAMCWVLAQMVGRIGRLHGRSRSGLTLTTLFSNANNYGLPVLILAYGQAGLTNGAIYVITQIILINTVGLYVASTSEVRPREAFLRVIRAPLIYAVVAGVLLGAFRIHLPADVQHGLKMLSDAYPGVVLLILGVQLGRIRNWKVRRVDVWIAVGLRVLIVPCLSYVTLLLLHIHGVLGSILLVQSSMPVAVNAIVLATKYGSDEELVTFAVAITTIISFATVPLLIGIGSHL